MANRPCSICQRAFGSYSAFFSPENDSKEFAQGPKVLLAPINRIKRAASLGCPICTVLISSLNTEFLGPTVRERQGAILQRTIIDPDRAVAIYVGLDDVSHTSFSRVPHSWSTYGQDPLFSHRPAYYAKAISHLRN
jgi:hypothetical protein